MLTINKCGWFNNLLYSLNGVLSSLKSMQQVKGSVKYKYLWSAKSGTIKVKELRLDMKIPFILNVVTPNLTLTIHPKLPCPQLLEMFSYFFNFVVVFFAIDLPKYFLPRRL